MSENNKLIAEFMEVTNLNDSFILDQFPRGVGFDTRGGYKHSTSYIAEQLKYHNSWDWLMPVIEKIGECKLSGNILYVVYACPVTFGMKNKEGNYMFSFRGHRLFSDKILINAAYYAVVDFIKHYNIKEK